MKFTIVLLLFCLLGWQIGTTLDAAAREVSKSEKPVCRSKVVL